MANKKKNVHIYPNKEKLVAATTEMVVGFIEKAIQKNGLYRENI